MKTPKILYDQKELVDNAPVLDDSYNKQALTLSDACSMEKIHSVGLIAGFASGKSSILQTLFKLLPRFSFLFPWSSKRQLSKKKTRFVSLADFDVTNKLRQKQSSVSEGVGANVRTEIENEIIKQLLFSVSPSTVPSSRIDRISAITRRGIFCWICFACSLIFGAVGAMMENSVWPFANIGDCSAHLAIVFFVLSGIMFFAFVSLLILILPVKKAAFSRKGIEVNAEKPVSISLKDQYFGELVYLFKKSKINLVIFEDIDRFEDVQLLLDIRALNFELNQDPTIQKRKGIVFLFAINESLNYTAEDQAKFFDFSLSVLPVLNPYNAAETMLASPIFQQTGLAPEKEEAILLSRHIPDRRVANQIINDYLVYSCENASTLVNQDDVNALFALMVYKHICPSDFALAEREDKNCHLIKKITSPASSLSNSANPEEESLLNDMVSNGGESYLDSDYLRYISRFNPKFLSARSDRDFYEHVVKTDRAQSRTRSLTDVAQLFELIPEKMFGKQSCLNINFAAEVSRRLSAEVSAGEPSKKCQKFVDGFSTEDPTRKSFLKTLIDGEDACYTKEILELMSYLGRKYPWIFNYVMSLGLEKKHLKFLRSFLAKTVFNSKTDMSNFLNSRACQTGLEAVRVFLSQSANPCDDFQEANKDAFDQFVTSSGIRKIAKINHLPKTPISDVIVNRNLLEPTSQNVFVYLSEYRSSDKAKSAPFSAIISAGNQDLYRSCLGVFSSFVESWFNDERNFSDEEEGTVKKLISDVNSNQADLNALGQCLSSAATNTHIVLEAPVSPQDRLIRIIDSRILVDDVNMLEILRPYVSPMNRLFSFAIDNQNTIPESFQLANSGQNFLACLLNDSTLSPNVKKLAQLLEKMRFPSVKLSTSFSLGGIEALSLSNCIMYDPSCLTLFKDSLTAFRKYVKENFQKIINESSLPLLKPEEAQILFDECSSSNDKKKVLQFEQKVLSSPKNLSAIKTLSIDSSFVTSSELAKLLISDEKGEVDLQVSIISNRESFLDRQTTFEFLCRNVPGCSASRTDGSVFIVETQSPFQIAVARLVGWGYLVPSGTETSGTKYVVSPSCRNKADSK
jgi:hypothetical protein